MNIRIKDVLYKIRWLFIPYMVVLCGCFFIKLLYTRSEIYFAVNSHYNAASDFLAPFFTDLGNGWTTIILSAILLLFSYRKAFLMITNYAVVSGLITQVIKYIFDAPRPKCISKSR